jgi:DNA helicase-2/ATP-dependent DNA helicase PcrA
VGSWVNRVSIRCSQYVHERAERLPGGNLADFARDCAARTVAGFGPLRTEAGDAAGVTLPTLVREYTRLRQVSALPELPGYTSGRLLAGTLRQTSDATPPEEPLSPWLSRLAESLELEAIAVASPDQRDQEALTGFHEADRRHALTVADIAAGALRTGKVTLTTYHSAKGREWDIVIMPGLVDGIMPKRS